MTPEEVARRSAAAMWSADRASEWFGMTLGPVGPGTARMSLTVAAHHCNGHGLCHGAVIFALADSAFAFACNSFNRRAVAQSNQITYLRPGREGDLLTACATHAESTGRTGIYDVCVTTPETTIALFRGISREIEGRHFDPDATP